MPGSCVRGPERPAGGEAGRGFGGGGGGDEGGRRKEEGGEREGPLEGRGLAPGVTTDFRKVDVQESRRSAGRSVGRKDP